MNHHAEKRRDSNGSAGAADLAAGSARQRSMDAGRDRGRDFSAERRARAKAREQAFVSPGSVAIKPSVAPSARPPLVLKNQIPDPPLSASSSEGLIDGTSSDSATSASNSIAGSDDVESPDSDATSAAVENSTLHCSYIVHSDSQPSCDSSQLAIAWTDSTGELLHTVVCDLPCEQNALTSSILDVSLSNTSTASRKEGARVGAVDAGLEGTDDTRWLAAMLVLAHSGELMRRCHTAVANGCHGKCASEEGGGVGEGGGFA